MSLSSKELEYLIFGTERQRRFTQDSPVLPDVWLEYNAKPGQPIDLLLTPYKNTPPSDLYKKLRERLRLEDEESPGRRRQRRMTYNESYVVAELTLDEVIRVALPLTQWWVRYLWPEALQYDKSKDKKDQDVEPEKAIPAVEKKVHSSASEDPVETLRHRMRVLLEYRGELENLIQRRRKMAAADSEEDLPPLDSSNLKPSSDLLWMIEIVGALRAAKDRQPPPDQDAPPVLETLPPSRDVIDKIMELMAGLSIEGLSSRPLLWAVQRNRDARGAIWKSSLAVKADAARLLFHISCKDLRWAIIDSGIDASHRAFRTRNEKGEQFEEWLVDGKPKTRVVEAYDFTRLRAILDPEDPLTVLQKDGAIRFDAGDRKKRKGLGEFRKLIEEGRMLDWGQLAKLIRVPFETGYKPPRNPHGTHVAGILGGDWRRDDGFREDHDLYGMCPDIELIDLRVLDDKGQSDEFTVLAALQFVRYMNGNQNKPYVQGVNMSLSLLHNVMNYACGRTPVCDECERLINNGTVVVAAAGNEGYRSVLTNKGTSDSYQDISITDPGNAEDVITVGATHRNRPFSYGVSYFSSRGPTGDGRIKPDLVAPGEKITGPVPDNGIDTFDGTSMAAPHVSGAAAMLMARHDELIGDPMRIKKILCDTATDLGRGRMFQGHGMLDVLRALQSV
ncbi:MAG TPA: S8 family peptidase [Thermoanaerobaculia bacterium]